MVGGGGGCLLVEKYMLGRGFLVKKIVGTLEKLIGVERNVLAK